MKGPVPEPLFKAACCGLQSPSSVRFRAALRAPLAAGVSTTSKVHVLPEVKGDVQVLFEIAKSPEFVPVKETWETLRSFPLPFVMVNVPGSLLAPGVPVPKLKDGGEMLTAVAQARRFTVVGLKKPPLEDARVTPPKLGPAM